MPQKFPPIRAFLGISCFGYVITSTCQQKHVVSGWAKILSLTSRIVLLCSKKCGAEGEVCFRLDENNLKEFSYHGLRTDADDIAVCGSGKNELLAVEKVQKAVYAIEG